MKKLLFVFAVCMGQSLVLPVYALPGVNEFVFKRDPPGKDCEGALPRYYSTQPIAVSICDDQLTIDFLNLATDVTITLTNTLTGEVVSCDFFETTEGTVIDLSSEESGEYQLTLISSEGVLQADFDL